MAGKLSPVHPAREGKLTGSSSRGIARTDAAANDNRRSERLPRSSSGYRSLTGMTRCEVQRRYFDTERPRGILPAYRAFRRLPSARAMDHLPVIDLSTASDAVARRVAEACRAHGFFYIVGHDVDEALVERLQSLSHRFFALPDAVKSQWAMPLGGRAWRGWFPPGG